MWDNSRDCAENQTKVPLASNSVVGSSNLSRRVIFINGLTGFRKIEFSQQTYLKAVVDG